MKKLAGMMLLALFILASCQAGSANDPEGQSTNKIGDIQEKTASVATLPTFLNNYSDTIVSIYEQVPHYHDVIQHMPCYCGCGMSVGHSSSYDCFIKEQNQDGSIVWDEHGAKCNVCLEIAYYSIELHNEGVPVTEIRTFIDERYKEGYAEPTNTPMPKEI